MLSEVEYFFLCRYFTETLSELKELLRILKIISAENVIN